MNAFVDGVRDILPEEIKRRKWVYQKLREVFSRDGYQEVATPTLESLDLYAGVESLLSKDRMFKVVDEQGKILVLRPDVTMPIARLAATRFINTPLPWKFSYITTAYQNNNDKSYQMKEKTQAGIELIGRDDLLAEVEVIGILIEGLLKLGIKEPIIDIGQAALVENVFRDLGLEQGQEKKLRHLMETKNLTEIYSRIDEWNLTEEKKELVTTFPKLFGHPTRVLDRLNKLPLSNSSLNIVEQMKRVFDYFKELNLDSYIVFDPTMVTRLGYYTGIIFKAYVKGYGEVVASGGRYNGLAKKFGLDVPAIGFAVEVEKLIDSLDQFQIIQSEKEKGLILKIERDTDFAASYQLASILRKKGIRVEIYTGSNPTEYCEFHQLKYIGIVNDNTFDLMDFTTKYVTKFTGHITDIANKCLVILKGGSN